MRASIIFLIFAAFLAFTSMAQSCQNDNPCSSSQTCCQGQGGVGCCPYQNAVCCSDGVHCCPNGYTCDVSAGTCNKSNSVSAMLSVAVTPFDLFENW
mmetsp:Transcript_44407/g.61757  ORF Transcript_44407/g.61757 Transcript_44407/m.61757 type:complete len:97 (+) Transcript_44407:59-349(+)